MSDHERLMAAPPVFKQAFAFQALRYTASLWSLPTIISFITKEYRFEGLLTFVISPL